MSWAPLASISSISAFVCWSSSRYVVIAIQTVAGTRVFPATFAEMGPANRVRLIVVLVAVAASAIVVGVVYATRQNPAQPSVRCKQGMKPYIVPGTPTANVAAVR